MSEVKKIATRESYGNALVELGAEHDNLIVLDADLAAATKTGVFKKAYPDRHIDCGIAECNMMGIAAGLSTTGIVPFASTFAMFAAGRAFEQVRNSIGYPHLNVKIGATHAGISVGEDGATHQCNEDIALMRTIPGMVILNPADDVEAKACVKAAYEYNGPVYLRFGRLAVPVINDRPDYKFELGKGVVLREGKDVTIVATGLCVSSALEAAEKLAEILRSKGAEKVVVSDLAREDMAEVIEDAFRYDRMIVAAASYDGGVFPCMQDFLHHLQNKAYQNRKVGIVENGSWGPTAARTMKAILEPMKNITIVDPVVTIKSTLKESDIPNLEALADAML